MFITTEEHTWPHVWTLITSNFTETSLLNLLLHFLLINYMILKNKNTFEFAWRRLDFFMLLVIAGAFASTTHITCRLLIYMVFKGESTYNDFQYSSTNLIIIALLLGLRQQATKPNTLTNKFDSGIPFISGNIVIPYGILP